MGANLDSQGRLPHVKYSTSSSLTFIFHLYFTVYIASTRSHCAQFTTIFKR